MSTLESIFWHVLGYSAMPVIILAVSLGLPSSQLAYSP